MPRRLAALLLALGPLAAQSLPLGFAVDVLAPNQRGPIGLDLLPDGRVVFVEQNSGAVKLLAGASVATIGTVPGLAVSYSRGLLAVAVDPGWPQRPFVYVLHTDLAAGDHRISRYTATGDLALPGSVNVQIAQPYVVLAGIPDAQPVHDGACLRFGPDGMLYVSTGDDTDSCASQDPTRLEGKMLRLDVGSLPTTGGGPAPRALLVAAGNPFAGPGDVAPLVWATGLRNPFRFHVDPQNGALFVADVGEDQLDEIDRIAGPGENLGWPWVEGDRPHAGCTGSAPASSSPIAVQTLGPGFTALISMGVYRSSPAAPSWFGQAYEGSYFYTDHFTGRIWRLAPRQGGYDRAPRMPGQPTAELWADGLPWIVDARVGRDGAIWFAERADSTHGSIRRLRPNGAAWASFGQGCAGTAAAPTLLGTGVPQLGQVFALRVAGLPAPTSVALGLHGLSRDTASGAPLPLDLAAIGMPGCLGLVAPQAVTLLLGQAGVAQWPLSLPLASALVGQPFFAQALVLDPQANALGAVVTNGGEGIMR